MHIAVGSSDGPNIVNMQLGIWKHAVAQYRQLQAVDYRPRPDLLSEPIDEEYSENEFMVDAAVAIILAGTSLSQLLGQNTDKRRNDGGIHGFWHCVHDVLGVTKENASKELLGFVTSYEALKHFGEPNYDELYKLTPEALCAHMTVAQEYWIKVLKRFEMSVPDGLFSNTFVIQYTME